MQTEIEREDNIVNISEPTIAIVSERHRNIILSIRRKDYRWAKICVEILNILDFTSKPLGVNNFYIEGVDEQKLN